MLHIPRERKIVVPRFGPVQTFGLRGRLRAIEYWPDTGEFRRHVNHNIITRAFLATVPLSFYQARDFYITQIGVGSGITTPTDTDTGLATEVLIKAITDPITETFLTGATPYSIATVQFNLAEANGNLTEAAQFDSDDSMANRALFGRGYVDAATNANPVGITSEEHGLTSGDKIRFDGVAGMTNLNFTTNGNVYYYVSVVNSDNFGLYTDSGLTTPLNGGAFGTFTPVSPETSVWTLVIEKTSSKILQVSFEMQAENAA